jgi:hypothetical protein
LLYFLIFGRPDTESSDSDDQIGKNQKLIKLVRKTKTDLVQIEKLLGKGTNVNFKDANRSNKTPLHFAASRGATELVKLLLANNADRTLSNDQGKTPFDVAANEEIRKLLCRQNQTLTSGPYEGTQTAAHGFKYQARIATLYAFRGRKYNYQIASEMKKAEKFDDVVFEYIKDGNKYFQLVQSKHKIGKNSVALIKTKDLKTKKGDYSLPKYLESFKKVSDDPIFKDHPLQLIIFTNIDIDRKDLADNGIILTKEVGDMNEILNLKGNLFQISAKSDFKATQDFADAEYQKFFANLYFAVNQPCEEELIDLIDKEVRKEFKLDKTQLITNTINSFVTTLSDKSEGEYLTKEGFENFLKDLKNLINVMMVMGITLEFENSLKNYKIVFKKENWCQDVIEFFSLSSTKNNMLILVTPPNETLFGSIKMNDILSELQLNRDSYIFASLSRLKNSVDNIEDVLAITKTVIIECNETPTKIFSQIFDSKKISKLILIVSKEASILERFPSAPKFNVATGFSNLDRGSQEFLLQKKVKFQGEDKFLKNIINLTEKNVYNDLISNKISIKLLLDSSSMEIGTPQSLDGFELMYYIPRILRRRRVAKNYIDYSTSRIYHKFIAHEPPAEVMKDGQTVLGAPDFPIYHSANFFDRFTETDLIKQLGHQKVFIISDVAGMGKSSFLSQMNTLIKSEHSTHWILRINLNDHSEAFKKEMDKPTLKKNDTAKALEFFATKLLKLDQDSLEWAMLSKEIYRNGKIHVFFDRFDEIHESYRDISVKLIKELASTQINTIWIATRTEYEDLLEKTFDCKAFIFEEFSRENQINFFINYKDKNKKSKFNEAQAANLVDQLMKSINDWERSMLGIPLQIRMVAELYTGEQTPQIINEPNLTIFKVFKEFIDKKKKDFFNQKQKDDDSNIAKQCLALYNEEFSIQKMQHVIALTEMLGTWKSQDIFKEFFVKLEKSGELSKISENKDILLSIGLCHQLNEKTLFIHRSFAEFFCTEFIAKEFNKLE